MANANTRAADLSVEALIGLWERMAKKLTDDGVPAERIAASLWGAATLLAADPSKLAPVAERLRATEKSDARVERTG